MHRPALLMAVITFAIAGLPGLAGAATFHVTSAECDGSGTFRSAVEEADATPGHDTVIVDPSLERIDITQCGPTLFNGNYGGTPLWNFSYVYVSDDLTIDALARRVEQEDVKEIVLATNPNLDGDGTALYISSLLGETGVKITRLARGLPSGGSIEYANKNVLIDAINGRVELK